MKRAAVAAAVAAMVIVAATAYWYFQPTSTGRLELAGRTLTVDLAKSPAQWERGLSGRASIAEDHGMLFVFDHPSQWEFWMQGMEFPLDIVWFDANRSVISYALGLPLCNDSACPTYAPPTDALYALEVNAGWVRANNVTVGETFNLVT
jgi:uncharacterized membrane protein (UPF0127 family)